MKSKELTDLIDLWKSCPTDKPPHVAPVDGPALGDVQRTTFPSFGSYIDSRSFCLRGETQFHFGLLPIPYCGTLERAEVFVLLLNPGLSNGDYHGEYSVPDFRTANIKNLFQDNAGAIYPFHLLDPAFSWHPGFVYWEKKFSSILDVIEAAQGITYQQALQYLSQRLACLELAGYHSKNYKALPPTRALPSTRTMVEYVQNDLLPRAKADEISIIVTRGSSHWGVQEAEGKPSIVVYAGAETQAAHLTIESRGGKEIIRRLNLDRRNA